ncbi:MAG: hypothetical protein ACREV9_11245 [Burkholderiales bacterium]
MRTRTIRYTPDPLAFVMDRMNYAEDDKKIMDEGKRKVLLVM